MFEGLSRLLTYPALRAFCRYTTRTTSTIVTNPPAVKVATSTTFWRNSIRRRVKIGKGRRRIAKSVRILIGDVDKNIEIRLIQEPSSLAKAARTGLHRNTLSSTSMAPATFTTTMVAIEARRRKACAAAIRTYNIKIAVLVVMIDRL